MLPTSRSSTMSNWPACATSTSPGWRKGSSTWGTRGPRATATSAGCLTTRTSRRWWSPRPTTGTRCSPSWPGFGLIGKQHVADFKKFDDVELAGMCDVYKPRLEEGLQYMGNPRAKGFSDFRKMLDDKDIQAVVVATPDHWHALLTIMACAAGKDVYVEKPMTVFNDEGKWMVQAARKYNRIVVVGTQR